MLKRGTATTTRQGKRYQIEKKVKKCTSYFTFCRNGLESSKVLLSVVLVFLNVCDCCCLFLSLPECRKGAASHASVILCIVSRACVARRLAWLLLLGEELADDNDVGYYHSGAADRCWWHSAEAQFLVQNNDYSATATRQWGNTQRARWLL